MSERIVTKKIISSTQPLSNNLNQNSRQNLDQNLAQSKSNVNRVINNKQVKQKSKEKREISIIENVQEQEENLSKKSINPTFILKYLNIPQLMKDYENGLFKNIRPTSTNKLSYKHINRIFISKLSTNDAECHSYKFTNKKGEDIITRTYGHEALKSYIQGKEYKITSPCFWCMSNISSVNNVNEEDICYLWEDYCYDVIEEKHIFWGIIPFCHPSCNLRFLMEELKKGKNGNYNINHLTILKNYCKLRYPDQEVLQADDKEILESNGGFKKYKDYHKNKIVPSSVNLKEDKDNHTESLKQTRYIRNPEIRKIPCRIEYTEC